METSSCKFAGKILIGVTGRAGSGKTTFARILTEIGNTVYKEKTEHLEADPIAWELYENPTIKKNLNETFGKKIFDKDGKLNRNVLGEKVFNNTLELDKLNAIMHPALLGELDYRIKSSTKKIIILDAALLLDWPIADKCNLLIVLETSDETAISRLGLKGMPAKRAKLILASQRPLKDFKKKCHLTLKNNLALQDLRIKAARVWKEHILPLLV